MVRIDAPPPAQPPMPSHVVVSSGTSLIRIFNPSRRATTPLTFRSFGPLYRFDHHRRTESAHAPGDDPDRAVYYATWSEDLAVAFSSALVEVFGDTRVVIQDDYVVASPIVTRNLQLLDLRGRGAMQAGTVAAIAKCEHLMSQAWSCHFYDHPDAYEEIDGLLYSNAHNDEPAIMLYERASAALSFSPNQVRPLNDPYLSDLLTELMLANGLR